MDDDIQAEDPGKEEVSSPSIKNTEIKILDDYESEPGQEFWDNFPRRELPTEIFSKVNVKNLQEEIQLAKPKMSKMELRRAEKAVKSLTEGAEKFLDRDLPPLNTRNAKSAVENGAVLRDTIATWIKKGFVAGPFETPPMEG